MSASQEDIDRLNDKDKAELRTFVANEQQRSQLQARMSPLLPPVPICCTATPSASSFLLTGAVLGGRLETHHVTQICWTKCVTGGIKNSKLDRSEETCLSNCVERFLDINYLTMKHLNSMRS